VRSDGGRVSNHVWRLRKLSASCLDCGALGVQICVSLMNPARIKILQQKLSKLAVELDRLETKLDEIVAKRGSANKSSEKLKCSREAGAVFPKISRVQDRIRQAKRLIAHAQGDEYQGSPFRT
jgi:hypothetical protein